MTRGVFTKASQDPLSAFQKYAQLHDAALSSCMFTAPKPLAYDENIGTLELEAIEGLVPLADVLPRTHGAMAKHLVYQVGAVLAALHGSWELPDASRLSDTTIFDGLEFSGDLVLSHGDFGLGNICCINGDVNNLVILDPEPAPFLGFPTKLLTHPELDAAHFISCLEGIFPFKFFVRYDWKSIPSMREQLISGYSKESGRSIDTNSVTVLASRLLKKFAENMRAPGRPLRQRVFGRFLEYRAKLMTTQTEY